MHVSNRIGVFILIGIFSLNSVLAQAQEDDAATEHKNFKVTSMISLGLSGPSYSTRFQLVDELGFEYDVMSLVEDKTIRHCIDLSDEQFGQMLKLKESVTSELQGRLASALASKNGKEEIEARFNEVEDEIRSIMVPNQVVLLEQSKIQRGIERFGLPEYLATSAMKNELDLTETERVSLKKMQAVSKSNHENRIKSLIEQANLALIYELSDMHQKKMDRLLTEEGMQEFLKSNLFVAKKSLRHRKLVHPRTLLGLLRIKQVREDLKLQDEQYEEIVALNKQVREMNEDELNQAMNQILSIDQINRLNRQGVKTETSRYGTVNELSHGLLSKLLGLTLEESEQIFQAGEQIFAELVVDMKQSKIDSLRESLDPLSAEKRDKVIDLIGKPTVLEAKIPSVIR